MEGVSRGDQEECGGGTEHKMERGNGEQEYMLEQGRTRRRHVGTRWRTGKTSEGIIGWSDQEKDREKQRGGRERKQWTLPGRNLGGPDPNGQNPKVQGPPGRIPRGSPFKKEVRASQGPIRGGRWPRARIICIANWN